MYQILRISGCDEAIDLFQKSRLIESHDMGTAMVHVIEHPEHGPAVLHMPVEGDIYLTKKS